jgi:flagellar biosynthesis protein FlhG
VLLVHANATDLARLFTRRALRPVLLAADQPESVTHAYAAMKLLTRRCALMSYDLLLAAPPGGARVPRIAQRLASCAESFLGAALCDWVAIDPACDVREAPGAALSALVAAQLRLNADEHTVADDGLRQLRQRAPAAPHAAMNLN